MHMKGKFFFLMFQTRNYLTDFDRICYLWVYTRGYHRVVIRTAVVGKFHSDGPRTTVLKKL
jgi:hypothetical protein